MSRVYCDRIFNQSASRSSKICDSDAAGHGETLAMEFNTLNLVQRLCGEITFTTARATDDGDVLDHQQIIAFAVASRNAADARAFLTANITYHDCSP